MVYYFYCLLFIIFKKLGQQCISTGWDVDKRELAMWDLRSFSAPFQRIVIDKSASYILPFYEEGTGMIVLLFCTSDSLVFLMRD